MGWFVRQNKSDPAPDPLEDGLGGVTLLAVLEEAVCQLDAVEALLERCAIAGDPGHAAGVRSADRRLGAAEARQGLRLRVTFTQLARWLDGMVCEPEQERLRAATSRLLRFYLLMISSALDAAFTPTSRQHIAVRGGRGGTAGRLIELRDLARAAVE
ncbi:hypothetical protein ASF88_14580 [Leifsonia sp. Leaf336]|uniref:hypothetical protein n=1 Tax=Leifsonia sp. Leaf336 TaxID=1736341 RepID=UPI0006F81EB0|nr:hypothetical protein [Leifsonia sp. Leaf336]KQR52714.1 hypothetical protein ASF88_14580 [Leifsonia sp. Leaf336]